MYINGKYMKSEGTPFDVFNPATEEIIGRGVSATEKEVDLAVESARNAFNGN